MKISPLILSVGICFLNSFMLRAQQSDDSLLPKIDAYLTSANQFYKFNGSALVAHHGNIILQKGYGYKNIDSYILNDANGIFQIASVSKSFMATVILKLQEEGKLSLNDELSKYFPEYKYADKITIENLLTHTSGIYNYTNDIDENDSAIVCNPVNKQLVLDIIFKKPLDFTPGTQFRYDNSGYFLLGLISEKVTGESYESLVKKIIFTPLGMLHSGFDFRHLTDTNKTIGYQVLTANEHKTAQLWDSTVTFGAGSIYSTTNDLYKLACAIANKQILSSASWRQAFTPHLEHYGYGFFIDSVFGKKYIMHSGGMPGFMSWFMYYPSEDITIILLNNEGYYGEGLTSIGTAISAILLNKPYQLMTAHTEINIPPDSLKKYTGVYAFDKKHKAIITLENDHLQIEAPSGGLPKSPLFAESQTLFYLKLIDAEIEFVEDAAGNITQLISHANGKDEVCKKVK